MDYCDLERQMQTNFFSTRRDIFLQINRRLFLGDGTEVTPSSLVPIGAVVFWPSTAGVVPAGWAVFAPLQGRFPVGADGATFVDGASGGAETINIQHNHTGATGAGTAHGHGDGTYATNNDTHGHGPGTLSTDTEANHRHNVVALGSDIAIWGGGPGYYDETDLAGSHSHSVNAGATGNDTHNHDVTGASANESAHTHSISNDLSAVQSIIPPYHCGEWIQRTA